MAAPPDVSLRTLVTLPEVPRTLASSLLGRLPYTAIALLLILRVRDAGGDYGDGGIVAGAFAVGLAALSPFMGRLVDQRGHRAVLLPAAIVSSVPLVVIALAPDDTPIALLAALAAVAGMTHPPVSGATRALWPEIVPAERRHAIYALESAGVELTFILGPLVLVGVVAAATSPSAGLLACVALLIAGTAWFASAPSSRRWTPSGVARTIAGALASRALLALLVIVACMGASFGAIEISLAASAEEHGHPALVGPFLAAWAAGSLAGGLAVARSSAPADPNRRLVTLLWATAAADALVAVAPEPWTLAIALVLAGSCIAPAFATLYAMVADVAREGTLTESYTWITTGITAGVALGSALGGAVVDAASTHAAMAGGAGMVVVATLVTTSVLGVRRSVAA
ncbi:MAG: MFS transporter [Thermoleophilia bacterium]